MTSPRDCEHPNPQIRGDAAGNVPVYCPDCKLSMSESQVRLVRSWVRKLEEMRKR